MKEKKSLNDCADRTRELCESISIEKQPDYENTGRAVAHDEKENEIVEKVRKHYIRDSGRHPVQFIGKKKSHGRLTSQYTKKSWYGEHSRSLAD